MMSVGLDTGGRVVTAEELHVIRAIVVVIVCEETQAELGGASLVDVGIPRAADDGSVPVADRRVRNVATAALPAAAWKSLTTNPSMCRRMVCGCPPSTRRGW